MFSLSSPLNFLSSNICPNTAFSNLLFYEKLLDEKLQKATIKEKE